MEILEYKKHAKRTLNINWNNDKSADVVILGIIGELGSLASVLKKKLRDKKAYDSYLDDYREELGDIVWYVITIATQLNVTIPKWPSSGRKFVNAFDGVYAINKLTNKLFENIETLRSQIKSRESNDFEQHIVEILKIIDALSKMENLSIELVAHENCDKILSYWCKNLELPARKFDRKYPVYEQLPRKFVIDFFNTNDNKSLILMMNGIALGDRLTSNSYIEDGYKYHDIFHIAGAVTLGWSPVFRRMLKLKRKSNSEVDEVEDGARAAIIEEALINHIYDYARPNYLKGMKRVSLDLIKRIRNLVRGYEVNDCEPWEWEYCILNSYEIFRKLIENKGGRLICDAEKREITYQKILGFEDKFSRSPPILVDTKS